MAGLAECLKPELLTLYVTHVRSDGRVTPGV